MLLPAGQGGEEKPFSSRKVLIIVLMFLPALFRLNRVLEKGPADRSKLCLTPQNGRLPVHGESSSDLCTPMRLTVSL